MASVTAPAPLPVAAKEHAMGRICLFAIPRVKPPRRWLPTENEIGFLGAKAITEMQSLRDSVHRLDVGILEKAAVVASVFGMPELAEMSAVDACDAMVDLVKRSDVCDVLNAHQRSRVAAGRKAC
jgi:hypothetical protein